MGWDMGGRGGFVHRSLEASPAETRVRYDLSPVPPHHPRREHSTARRGRRGLDARAGAKARLSDLWREQWPARLRAPGRGGPLERLRRRFLPRARGRHFRRSGKNALLDALGQGSREGAAIRDGRSPGARRRLDLVARRGAGALLRRDHFLRRTGISRAQKIRRFATRSRRAFGLRAAGHALRARSRRFSPRRRQADGAQAVPDIRGGGQGLFRRQMRGVDRRSLDARRRAAKARGPCRSRDSARAHRQGAARPDRAAGRRPMVRHRPLDAFRHGGRRGAGRELRQCG